MHPGAVPETLLTDHWRCRFEPTEPGTTVRAQDAVAVPAALVAAGLDVVGTDHLHRIDGRAAYSSGASA